MASVTLTYDLLEEEYAYRTALDGHRYRSILEEMWNELRAKVKYGDLPDKEHEIYATMKRWLEDAIAAEGLEIP